MICLHCTVQPLWCLNHSSIPIFSFSDAAAVLWELRAEQEGLHPWPPQQQDPPGHNPSPQQEPSIPVSPAQLHVEPQDRGAAPPHHPAPPRDRADEPLHQHRGAQGRPPAGHASVLHALSSPPTWGGARMGVPHGQVHFLVLGRAASTSGHRLLAEDGAGRHHHAGYGDD